tara:strand:- start:1231 stop:3246 length:2016 start_codon:yes stop_codon:yes gene_type:complete
MEINISKNKYREEIDGIRALAIIAVIINHFNKDFLPSGYLGVDIFFVISGYVITNSLSSIKSGNFFNFIFGFYARRIKRLLPPLIIFISITSIILSFFDLNPQSSLRTGISALFGLSNIYLIKQSTNYFAQSTEFNVFAHTWSLGVEQQFYFFFPIIIWFTGFKKKCGLEKNNLLKLISIFTGLSFFYYCFLNNTNPSAAYFLMPSRFWEIGIGCILFCFNKKENPAFNKSKKLTSILIFALIVSTFFLPQDFGFIKTIIIVFLTALLIHSISRDSFIFKILTNKKIIHIGLISYPLYLWHWGILALSRWTIGIQWWTIPIQLLVIYFLSFASYEWVEKPIKNNYFLKQNWTLIFKGIFFSIISSLFLYLLEMPLRSKLYLGRQSLENREEHKFKKTIINKKNCIYNPTKQYKTEDIFKNCFYLSNKNSQTMFFIGDSHNASFLEGAEFIAKKSKANLFTFSAGNVSFPPILYSQKKENDFYLKKLNTLFKKIEKDIILKSSEKDIVFITMYMPGKFLRENWHGKKYKNLRNWILGLENFVIKMSKKNVNVIISTPTPEFELARLKRCRGQNPQWFNKLNQIDCTIPISYFKSKGGEYYELIKELKKTESKFNNLFLFNSIDTLCDDDICKYYSDGQLLYKSQHHLSIYAARNIIAPKLVEFLEVKNLILN